MADHVILEEFQETILTYIYEEPLGDQVYGHYQSLNRLKRTFDDSQILSDALRSLRMGNYIEHVTRSLGDGAHIEGYKLLPRAKNYLRKTGVHHSTNFSGIKSSNIAINSESATQKIAKNETTKSGEPNKVSWFWWAMGIIGSILAGLILFYIFRAG